jgi:uncharacterized protein (TIGR02246 family)
VTADEQAFHGIVKHLEDAWNRSDSIGFAAPFQDDATFIPIFDGQLDGRQAVEASHRSIFDTIYKGSHAEFSVRSMRFLRADVVIVFIRAQVGSSEAGETRTLDTRPTLVMVREQGQWWIVAFQNTKTSEMPVAAAAASRLAT